MVRSPALRRGLRYILPLVYAIRAILRGFAPAAAGERAGHPTVQAAAQCVGRAACLCAAAVVAVTAGCAAGPAVRGVKAEQVTTTADATHVNLTLEMLNTNDAPIELTEWHYSATVNGRTVYSGTWVAALTLPARVPMTTTIPVVIPRSSEVDIAHTKWSVGGSVGYRATRQIDRLLYQLGINRLSAGFDVRGDTITHAAPAPAATPQPAAMPPLPAPPPPTPPQ